MLIYLFRDDVDNHSHLHYSFSMFVCICKQVTDGQIKEAVSNGAASFSDVQSKLGVATQCGECKNHARKCMRQCSNQCSKRVSIDNQTQPDILAGLA